MCGMIEMDQCRHPLSGITETKTFYCKVLMMVLNIKKFIYLPRILFINYTLVTRHIFVFQEERTPDVPTVV